VEDKNSDKAKKLAAQDLLRRAQEQIRSIKDDKSAAKAQQVNDSPAIFQKIVHQLQVHQIELEMQNEEIRRTQFELEIARLRYFDLYDLAPVGYCTLSEQGLILEGNLMAAKLFDCSRGDLVNKPMSRFVCKVDQDIYYLHRKRLLSTGAPQTCEVRIINNSGEPIWVNLNSSFEKDSDGVPFLRIVITDISARKQAELTLRLAEERYHSEQNQNQIRRHLLKYHFLVCQSVHPIRYHFACRHYKLAVY
jgi:PAS domain S-box-containing protein